MDPFPIYCRQVNCFSSGFGEFPQESKRRHIGILYINNSYYFSEVHTSYLSFLLHRQDFRKPNFTPKKTTKITKNTKNVSEKVIYMHFFTHSGKIYTWQKIFTQTCLWCLWQIKGMFSSWMKIADDVNTFGCDDYS